MNFLKFFLIITEGISVSKSVGNFISKSVGNKKYYYRRVFSVSKSVGNNIFLLPTDLLTEKKLPTKDSPTEHLSMISSVN
jgi:hypothetical protein